MTNELCILSLCSILGVVQILVAATAAIKVRGLQWAASARDVQEAPLSGVTARLDRIYKNYLETFPFFVAAVLVAHGAGCHNDWTLWGGRLYLGARLVYIPLYLAGVPMLRTVVWFVSIGGIIAMLVAPAL